jgi:hypothetical protein
MVVKNSDMARWLSGDSQTFKPNLFAPSLSKGKAEPVEATSLRSVEGFDFAQPERMLF